MSSLRNILIVAAVAIVVAAVAVLGLSWLDRSAKPLDKRIADLFPPSQDYAFDPPMPGTYMLPPLKGVPDGTLVDHADAEQKLSAVLDGKVSLVSFVYFLCTDSDGCPLATATLYDLYDVSAELPGLAKKAQLVTVSFDPERDTPEAVESFIYPVLADPERATKIDWRAFTTRSVDDLKPILDGFGQAVDRRPDSEVINHLLRLYLVDAKGRVRNIYGLGMIDPRLILTDIETLMMESGDTVADARY